MKRIFRIAETLVILMVMSVYTAAQIPTYSCVATADTLMTSKIYQFDVYIYRTGSTNLYLNNYQLSFRINNSSGILNGGSVTGYYVSGSTELPTAFAPGGVSIFNIGGILYIRVNGCTSSSCGTLIPTTGLRIGSFRFTNSNDYGQINPYTITWNSGPATTYVYAIVPPAPTGTVLEISDMTSHTTLFTDPIFNSPVTAFNMTGSGNYCSGGTGLTVGLDGSQGGVMYRLIKNGAPVGSYIPGTGSSISFGNQTEGTYTATAYRKATYLTNNMSGSAVVTQITVTPTISGNTVVCAGSAGNVYTTEPGMTNYIWTVSSGGTITSGGTPTSNSVTVTWNTAPAQTVTVNYSDANGCTAATPTVKNVTVNPLPVPTIAGQTSVCTGTTNNTYSTEAGMSNYQWNISSGGTITGGNTTNSILVQWNTPGAQWLSVTYANANGCYAATPTVLNVTVNPLPGAAGTITGTASLCAGAQGIAYSVDPITNTTYYVWTLPPGATIASGDGTNSITVDFATNAVSGDITVYGNNVCGNGATSPPFPVIVIALPDPAGTISGPSDVCEGQTGVQFSVPVIPGATGYIWTLPAGATIESGENTNSITVAFPQGTSSGIITVTGTNPCGNGQTSPDFQITVNPIPGTPHITAVADTLHSNAPAGNQWYYNGDPVAGGTEQMLIAQNTGWYWDVVTLEACSSDTSNHIFIVVTGINPTADQNQYIIYPVPNDGIFTARIITPNEQTFNILIYDQVGVRIYESKTFTVKGMYQKKIDLRPTPSGVYTVVFKSSDHSVIRKIMINK